MVSYVGYASQRPDGFNLPQGQKQTLREEGVELQGVEATANRDAFIDRDRTGAQTNISDAQPISLDAIDQRTVSLSPYDVTQGGRRGLACTTTFGDVRGVPLPSTPYPLPIKYSVDAALRGAE